MSRSFLRSSPIPQVSARADLVKTCVATTRAIEGSGRDLATEADRRGPRPAGEPVCVRDDGHGLPAMVARECGDARVHCVT
ncbi:MAG: hypothetical protein ACYS9X_32535, partial [Planctomycetota bacterium]